MLVLAIKVVHIKFKVCTYIGLTAITDDDSSHSIHIHDAISEDIH